MAVDRHLDVQEEFDALLRKELSIEPTPAFLPRVRERISAQPAWTYSRWRVWFLGTAAAVTCVVVVVASGAIDPATAPPAAPSAPAFRVGDPVSRLDAPQAAAPAVPAPARWHASRRPLVSAPSQTEPVVIVDERQRAALTAVIRMVGEGRLTEDSFKKTTPPSMQPIRDHVVPIGVKPVELSPLTVGGVVQLEK